MADRLSSTKIVYAYNLDDSRSVKVAAGNVHENPSHKSDLKYLLRSTANIYSPETRHEYVLPDMGMLISSGAWLTTFLSTLYCRAVDVVGNGLELYRLLVADTPVVQSPNSSLTLNATLFHFLANCFCSVGERSTQLQYSTHTRWHLIYLSHDVPFRLHIGYVVAPSEHLLRNTLHRQDLPVPPATNLRRGLQS